MEMLKLRKNEIVSYLGQVEAEARRTAEEREAKIQSIEGLAELEKAIEAEREYRRAFNRMMDDEYNDGAFCPSKPAETPTQISARYPRAAAYVQARKWKNSANFDKSAAGEKALEAIINGEDYEMAINNMMREWDACTNAWS